MITRVTIDILTLIFTHILLCNERKDEQRESNPLLQLLLDSDIFNVILAFVGMENLQIREHTIQVLQILFFTSPEFYIGFKQKMGFQLMCKTAKASSLSLCQTILHSMMSKFDNVYHFQRFSHLITLQVLNKSPIANEIMIQTCKAMKRVERNELVYFEFLDYFLECVRRLGHESHE